MKSAKSRFLEPYGCLSKPGGEWGVNLKIPEGGRVCLCICVRVTYCKHLLVRVRDVLIANFLCHEICLIRAKEFPSISLDLFLLDELQKQRLEQHWITGEIPKLMKFF